MAQKPEERFKRNFITLVDICNDMVEEGETQGISSVSSTIINIAKIFISKLEPEFLIERFVRKTYEHWDKIYEKDLDYFADLGLNLFNMTEQKGVDGMLEGEEKGMFGAISMDHISGFKKLLSATYNEGGSEVKIFDDERVEDVWKIMHSFVKQSISYIHERRTMVDGQYTKDYFSNVNVKENAEKWKVKNLV